MLGSSCHWFHNVILEENSVWKFACLRDLQIPPFRQQVFFQWIHLYVSAFGGSSARSCGLSISCCMRGHGEDDKISNPKSGEEGATVVGTPVGTLPSAIVTSKTITTTFPPASGAEVSKHEGVPSNLWVKSEREIKRDRRKPSNRESARRLRLRKQAEPEELATKVEVLYVENMYLKSKISQLAEKPENLKHQQNFFNYISIRLQTAVSALVRPTMTKETIKVPQVTEPLTYTGGCINKKPKIRQAMCLGSIS
ncbi:transcriptional activator TAF-1-like isoform X1 [Papaver somniferum]|uniref:transcriptional activator TAF-1-like isoform X1 n=1 Tax=Papaver somniferum TaxID=3469 RepID=UPI000E702CC0|nr:transcriptional activator TAF-1-like isoform X1 [Papaver somniferum]XP_026452940.1 transcriptional activator TAF-1-like isoform X1 [Papaver somniferum]XP_026452941.1 transcriptional activator TAF-1-like isoform X1 [Papaver somniferum]XP_026452942.1 transcriptional activator TAF-1-like isoform X1 [Papaver somniferum]